MSRYGKWLKCIGENIDFGNRAVSNIVVNLIVDDGTPSRGHRLNIFNPGRAGCMCCVNVPIADITVS